MQTHIPNTWDDPSLCRRLALLTDNGMAWRFRARLAAKDFAVLDCRGAAVAKIREELARLRPDLIAVSLRDPQRYAPAILDYASANECAGYCLFWAGRQQWLRGLDPQLLQRLEEARPSGCGEASALKDAIALARLLFMTHQGQGPICVDFADIGTWLASGGHNARVVVKSIFIPGPPQRGDCDEPLRRANGEFADVRGGCFCLEGRGDNRLPEFQTALDAMTDAILESAIAVFGIPIRRQAARLRGLPLRLSMGLVWLPPEAQHGDGGLVVE